MRKKQTFLLTIMTPETGSSTLCGQIKVIASGKTSTFTSLEELYRLLAGEMNEEASALRMKIDMALNEEKAIL